MCCAVRSEHDIHCVNFWAAIGSNIHSLCDFWGDFVKESYERLFLVPPFSSVSPPLCKNSRNAEHIFMNVMIMKFCLNSCTEIYHFKNLTLHSEFLDEYLHALHCLLDLNILTMQPNIPSNRSLEKSGRLILNPKYFPCNYFNHVN